MGILCCSGTPPLFVQWTLVVARVAGNNLHHLATTVKLQPYFLLNSSMRDRVSRCYDVLLFTQWTAANGISQALTAVQIEARLQFMIPNSPMVSWKELHREDKTWLLKSRLITHGFYRNGCNNMRWAIIYGCVTTLTCRPLPPIPILLTIISKLSRRPHKQTCSHTNVYQCFPLPKAAVGGSTGTGRFEPIKKQFKGI